MGWHAIGPPYAHSSHLKNSGPDDGAGNPATAVNIVPAHEQQPALVLQHTPRERTHTHTHACTHAWPNKRPPHQRWKAPILCSLFSVLCSLLYVVCSLSLSLFRALSLSLVCESRLYLCPWPWIAMPQLLPFVHQPHPTTHMLPPLPNVAGCGGRVSSMPAGWMAMMAGVHIVESHGLQMTGTSAHGIRLQYLLHPPHIYNSQCAVTRSASACLTHRQCAVTQHVDSYHRMDAKRIHAAHAIGYWFQWRGMGGVGWWCTHNSVQSAVWHGCCGVEWRTYVW